MERSLSQLKKAGLVKEELHIVMRSDGISHMAFLIFKQNMRTAVTVLPIIIILVSSVDYILLV